MGHRGVAHESHRARVPGVGGGEHHRLPALHGRVELGDDRPRAVEQVRRLEDLERRVAVGVGEPERLLEHVGRDGVAGSDRRVAADQDPAVGQQRRGVVVGPAPVGVGQLGPGPRLRVEDLGRGLRRAGARSDDLVPVGAAEGDDLTGRQAHARGVPPRVVQRVGGLAGEGLTAVRAERDRVQRRGVRPDVGAG